MTLNASLLRQYDERGFLSPLPILTPEQARLYRARLEDAERQRGRPLTLDEKMKPHLLFSWAAELARHPAVLDAVSSIVGPDILIWESVILVKESGGKEHFTWHQDILYWGLEPPDQIVTAWIALSPSTPESGCMRVVPGSHTSALAPHVNTYDPDNLLGRGQEIQTEVDEDQAFDIVLQPGQMSLHHVMIIHGSDPNTSNDPRHSYAIRYIPASVKQKAPVRDCATLVHGVDRYGHFDLEPLPSEFDSPAAASIHAAARRQRAEVKKYI